MSGHSRPIFVDANIPMYAHGREHSLREPCRAAIVRLGRGEVESYTSTEIHQEILYRYLSLRRPAQALRVSRDFALVIPQILPVTQRDIETVWDLMMRYPGLSSRDYIHIAVMLNNDLTHILSADAHFDLVNEIERIPPEQFTSQSGL
jgi:predicted nucleic acid-binding protein